MGRICQNCGRGIGYGNAVSHAKNRTKRIFKPNLQKLKVMKNGNTVRVKLCTRCIQRLKMDRRLGQYKLIQYVNAEKEVKQAVAGILEKIEEKKEVKEKIVKEQEELKIEDIVGKK